MKILPEHWDKLSEYLISDKKLSDTASNIGVLRSRFNLMCKYFHNTEFNRENFTGYISYLKRHSYSTEYMNNFIKLAKHIDKFFGVNQMQDYTYFPKVKKYKEVLTYQQIEDMADVNVPYDRDRLTKNTLYRAVIYTLLITGARISEVLNLRWEDIKDNPRLLILNQTKTKELRYSPISLDLYNMLHALPKYSGYIFSNKNGEQIMRQTVSNDLKRRAEIVGIPNDVNNHLLRHSFVNFMLKRGTPFHIVSKMVGHKRIQTTYDYYEHSMINELAEYLHLYHPHLNKHNSMDFIKQKFKELAGLMIDNKRHTIKIEENRKKLAVEIIEHNE